MTLDLFHNRNVYQITMQHYTQTEGSPQNSAHCGYKVVHMHLTLLLTMCFH